MALGSLLLILLQASTGFAQICSAPTPVNIDENNSPGTLITHIRLSPGATVTVTHPTDLFSIRNGNELIATAVLDHEVNNIHVVTLRCIKEAAVLPISIVVSVLNINDNHPVFDKNLYTFDVNEMSPVGGIVGSVSAQDADRPPQLYYTLIPETHFKLRSLSSTRAEILVAAPLNYDKQNRFQMELRCQDTPPTDSNATFVANTTIVIDVMDGDNRPPWFQPCTRHVVGEDVICQSAGYTGSVVLNQQEDGALPLEPGPVYAIDGDFGINEAVTYSFLSGNNDNLFEINANTGNITMLKPVDVYRPIVLTVMASHNTNSFLFATTSVTIKVNVKTEHQPKFPMTQYDATITAVGTMATDEKGNPLQIFALDDDYAAEGGINPYITYSIKGNSNFIIIDGYLFMTKPLPEGNYTMQVVAKDTSNDETSTTQLSVTVTSGLTSTTDIMTTTSIVESTTDSIVSTTFPITSATNSSDSSVSTNNPSTTAHPLTAIAPSGGFESMDMALLGGILGVLLFICLVVIGVLAYCVQKGKADWGKVYEANAFRSSLGQSSGGVKEGVQYMNEAFQNDDDDDGGSIGFVGPEGRSVMATTVPQQEMEDGPLSKDIMKSLSPQHTLLPDETEQTSLDNDNNEKEVKPILTKERRMEEGYKSVWFKEDIDPNAKEEVVIIPDSREDDIESISGEEEEDSNHADMDSGLGVKIEDPSDSDGEQVEL